MSELAATAERLTRKVPGVVLAATTPWFEEAVAGGYRTVGWDDDGRHGVDEMTVDTHHDLASVTKVVGTTTALLRLVSARQVDLDTAVRRYLPGFSADVTVRDLLLHRAGLWEWWPLYLSKQPVEELPLRYEPGKERHYSDLGFILLGRIIAQVVGEGLEQAVAELVTRPLGLGSTRFARPAGEVVATGAWDDRVERKMLDTGEPYPVPFRSSDFEGWREYPINGEVADGNAFHAFGGVAGHAGLFSTVPDLLRWAEALSNYEEHDDLWRPEIAREFFAPGPDESQALGFRRYQLKVPDESGSRPERSGELLTVLGHPGYVGCAAGFVPGRGIAVALATNRLLVDGEPAPTEQLLAELLTATTASLRQHPSARPGTSSARILS